jgi:hypothetical protein
MTLSGSITIGGNATIGGITTTGGATVNGAFNLATSASETWQAGYGAIQRAGNFARLTTFSDITSLSTNAYQNSGGTWTNLSGGVNHYASRFVQFDGTHEFYAGQVATDGASSGFELSVKFLQNRNAEFYKSIILKDSLFPEIYFGPSSNAVLSLDVAGASLRTYVGGSIRTSLTASAFTSNVLVATPASTTTNAGLRIPHGTAPTSPVNGDVWTTTAGTFVRINGATATLATLGSQTFTGTQTFNIITSTNTITGRQLAQTRQTSATTTGAIAWALGSGGAMDLTGTLTGGVTMNITAPSAGAWSALFVTQGATPQTVTLSLTGVSWILTGANGLTGTNTIVIPTASFIANKSSVIQLYWSTATRCYVTVT